MKFQSWWDCMIQSLRPIFHISIFVIIFRTWNSKEFFQLPFNHFVSQVFNHIWTTALVACKGILFSHFDYYDEILNTQRQPSLPSLVYTCECHRANANWVIFNWRGAALYLIDVIFWYHSFWSGNRICFFSILFLSF